MKQIIHLMTCAIGFAISWSMNAYAQDKVFFVPDPETARWSYLEMDGNGTTTATMTYYVDSMIGDAVNGTAKVKFERAGKQSSDEATNSFMYYKFKDGEFTIDMNAFFEADVLGDLIDAVAGAEGIGASEEEKKKAIEEMRKLIEISGEVRGIPRYPVIGALPDYEFVFKLSFVTMTVKGTERKISGKEVIDLLTAQLAAEALGLGLYRAYDWAAFLAALSPLFREEESLRFTTGSYRLPCALEDAARRIRCMGDRFNAGLVRGHFDPGKF